VNAVAGKDRLAVGVDSELVVTLCSVV